MDVIIVRNQFNAKKIEPFWTTWSSFSVQVLPVKRPSVCTPDIFELQYALRWNLFKLNVIALWTHYVSFFDAVHPLKSSLFGMVWKASFPPHLSPHVILFFFFFSFHIILLPREMRIDWFWRRARRSRLGCQTPSSSIARRAPKLRFFFLFVVQPSREIVGTLRPVIRFSRKGLPVLRAFFLSAAHEILRMLTTCTCYCSDLARAGYSDGGMPPPEVVGYLVY
jgi:hypothetical protein